MADNVKEIKILKKRIEKKRKKLNQLVEEGKFSEGRTLKISQNLDVLLVEYIKLVKSS